MEGHAKRAPLAKGIAWGFLGGLASTMVMDILLMGALLVLRQPALMCFSIVGDTVSRFLAMFGTQIAGGVPTGVVAHYVIGPLFGMLFGVVVTQFPTLREGTLKKVTIAAFVYVEILSQPILATTPILLKMGTPATLQWFGGSFVMHLILSIVLGVIVGYGLLPSPLTTQRRSQ
jgi:uncharacterized membrane protein YagU involved in acid resistance